MPQLRYQPRRAIPGAIVQVPPNARNSILNPLRAQVSLVDIDGQTTDGNYRISARDVLEGALYTHTPFEASSNTAAQIAAGVVSQWNASALASRVARATVVNVDQVQLAFFTSNRLFTVAIEEDASSGVDLLANSIEPGFTLVKPGIILQSDLTGGFTTAFSDATLAMGVVFRGAKLAQSLENPTADIGYKGGVVVPYADEGVISVELAAGVSVDRHDQVFFNGTTATWSNVTTGSHVAVPGAAWRSSGSGVQDVFFRLPSAA